MVREVLCIRLRYLEQALVERSFTQFGQRDRGVDELGVHHFGGAHVHVKVIGIVSLGFQANVLNGEYQR